MLRRRFLARDSLYRSEREKWWRTIEIVVVLIFTLFCWLNTFWAHLPPMHLSGVHDSHLLRCTTVVVLQFRFNHTKWLLLISSHKLDESYILLIIFASRCDDGTIIYCIKFQLNKVIGRWFCSYVKHHYFYGGFVLFALCANADARWNDARHNGSILCYDYSNWIAFVKARRWYKSKVFLKLRLARSMAQKR